jgi:hypothetical protein
MELDVIDSLLGEPEAAVSEPVVESPAAEPTEGPARDAQGRFAPKAEPDPAPEPAEAAPAAPVAAPVAVQPAPAPAQPPEGYVPVSVVQELRKEIKALRAPPPSPPAPAPDFESDPSGAWAYQQQQFQQQLLNERLNSSERFARREHGAETVDKAKAWALERMQADPLYYQQLIANADPYEAAVQDWKRDQVLSSMKDGDLDAFLAWKSGQAAQPQAQPSVAAAPVAIPPPPTPPRSLASAPAAGAAKPGDIPVGPGAAFDKL